MLRALLVGAMLTFGAVGLAPAAVAGPPYKNCSEAHADGAYNIQQGEDGYASKLDRDGDGYACEPKP